MIPTTQDRIEAAKIISCEITGRTLLGVCVWSGVAFMLARWAWGVA